VATAHPSDEQQAARGAIRLLSLVLLAATVASLLSTLCFLVYLLAAHISALTGVPVSLLYALGLLGLGAAEAFQILASFVVLSQWILKRGGRRSLRELIVLLISLIPFVAYVIFFVTVIVYLRARRQARESSRAIESREKVKEQAFETVVGALSDVSSTAAQTTAAPSTVSAPTAHATMRDAIGRVVGPTTQRSLSGVGNRVVSVALSSVLLATVAGAAVVTTGGPLSAGRGPNIVLDGDFEQPNLNGLDFAEYSAGQTFGSWTVGDGSVDLMGPYWVPAHGAQSLDLNGSGAGTIYQDLTTHSGQYYLLSLAMAGNPVCDPTVKQMQVWWGNVLVASPMFDITGHGADKMGWKELTYDVQATHDVTRLKFVSLSDSACGVALDTVTVK
jgi:choice-of-anchor C domain-containing protein